MLLVGAAAAASVADLKAAARTLASGLRQAQTTAMATRRDAVLTLDVESRELRDDAATRRRASCRRTSSSSSTPRNRRSSSERRGSIRFYPDGSSTGGRITVAAGERKYLVDVDWLTGPGLDR